MGNMVQGNADGGFMMRKRFQTTLATPEDDAALREILRQTPLRGSVSVTLEREPSFFRGVVDSSHHEVVSIRNGDESIIAMGSRCERSAWLDGTMQTVAYLSDLRVAPAYRNSSGRILVEGFRFMRQLNACRPVASTYTAIFEDNTGARQVLIGGRAGLPQYIDHGRLHCPALLVRRHAKPPKPSRLQFRPATTEDWPAITSLLNARYPHRNFAPVHTAKDFIEGVRWPGLSAEAFILAYDDDHLTGCVALWDLRLFRQIRVTAYHGWLQRLHGPLSAAMRHLGWSSLARTDELLPAAFISFLAVTDNNVCLANQLINYARYFASLRSIGFLFTCMHERDPLLPSLKGWLAIPSYGRLYEVAFDGKACLSSREPPHVEAALL